jgi:hypothetical protein
MPALHAGSSRLCGVLLTVAALAACASAPVEPNAPERAQPWQPEANVPAPAHASAFATYRPHVEQPLAEWRAVNEAVNRVGGWRTYGREAEAPLQPLPPLGRAGQAPPAAAPGTPPAPPAAPSKEAPR